MDIAPCSGKKEKFVQKEDVLKKKKKKEEEDVPRISGKISVYCKMFKYNEI